MTILSHLEFQSVVQQLGTVEGVAGLLTIGSLTEQTFHAASDYDLVLVLQRSAPAWDVGVTSIAQRFTDLLFVATGALEQILALTKPVPADHELGPIVRWLRDGQILFDRTGLIQQAQAKAQHGEWIGPISDKAAYGSWFAINYNLAQTRRMLQSSDSLYQATAAIRMAVYGHTDLWFGYFTIRRMDSSDKAAVRYLEQHDPAFLASFQQFIQTQEPEQKFALYQQAAVQATQPLGGIWPLSATVIRDEQATQLWQDLCKGSANERTV